jgi:hypothetical protein
MTLMAMGNIIVATANPAELLLKSSLLSRFEVVSPTCIADRMIERYAKATMSQANSRLKNPM